MKKTSRKKGTVAKTTRKQPKKFVGTPEELGAESTEVSERKLRLQRWYRPRKLPVTLRLDAEVLDWFQREGRGYQTRINQALRRLVMKAKSK